MSKVEQWALDAVINSEDTFITVQDFVWAYYTKGTVCEINDGKVTAIICE